MTDSPPEDGASWVEVGKTGRAHGIDGEIRIFTAEPHWDYFEPGATLYLETRDEPEAHVLESWRVVDEFVIAGFESIDDRTAAERRTNRLVYVDASVLPDLESDEFYHYEIEGREVYLEPDPAEDTGDLQLIGTVEGVFETGANDVVVVELDEGDELFVPMFEGAIAEMDRDEDRVVLRPLEEWAPEGTEI